LNDEKNEEHSGEIKDIIEDPSYNVSLVIKVLTSLDSARDIRE
jgi:hypothetical protein